MKRLRAWLAEPTLVRRSVWSVLLAFVVVWAVLLAYEYALNRHALATGPNLQKFGRALANALRAAAIAPADAELPQGDGMTAAMLAATLRHALAAAP